MWSRNGACRNNILTECLKSSTSADCTTDTYQRNEELYSLLQAKITVHDHSQQDCLHLHRKALESSRSREGSEKLRLRASAPTFGMSSTFVGSFPGPAGDVSDDVLDDVILSTVVFVDGL